MNPSSLFLLVSCLNLLQLNPRLSLGYSVVESPIRLRILEFDSVTDRLLQISTSRDSDIIYGEGIGRGNPIVLECRSNCGPVAFIYKGDGTPDYVVNANTTRSIHGVYFWAFMSFTRLPRAQDTGNYSCVSMTNDQLSNSIHLYIPDYSTNTVFVPTRFSKRLEFSRSDGSVRIPCSVTHPDATVSLERISTSREYRSESFGRVTYNPKRGFHVPMSMVSPGGSSTFLCRGELNGITEESMYQLFSEEPVTEFKRVTAQNYGQQKPAEGLVSPCSRSTCGTNAECIVIEYNAECVCFEGFSGDARNACYRMGYQSQQLTVQDPCIPSKCGRFSQCIVVNGQAICSCQPNYYGTPPYCTDQKPNFCSTNNDCEWEEYCNQRTKTCESVCRGSVEFCGKNSKCLVVNHTPFCECLTGFKGNPYNVNKNNQGCQSTSVQEKPHCEPTTCGIDALCRSHPKFRQPICVCPNGFSGDATSRCFKLKSVPQGNSSSYTENTPEDVQKVLCNRSSCGVLAQCTISNNQVKCDCPVGFKGDPYSKCTPIGSDEVDNIQLCNACGPNSICKMTNSKVFCECAPDSTGLPPNCQVQRRDFCRDNIDCPEDKVCLRGACANPCSWACSPSALCEVKHHITRCRCPKGFEGDAQFSCKKPDIDANRHSCRINCGPNTVCRAVSFEEVKKYRETLRKGKMEAIFFDMIRANENYNLQSGVYSECFCRKDFEGNPYSVAGCNPISDEDLQFPVTIVMDPADPCKPSPCGPSSSCKGYNGRAFCSCIFNATGKPPKCKLRCQADKDCLFNETCKKGLCESF